MLEHIGTRNICYLVFVNIGYRILFSNQIVTSVDWQMLEQIGTRNICYWIIFGTCKYWLLNIIQMLIGSCKY